MRAESPSDPSKDHAALNLGSCVNLTVGIFWDELRHRYARCRLGDGAARLARLKTQIADSEAYVNTHADFDDVTLGPPPSIMPPR